MIRLLPDTVAGRTFVVLVIGLALSHILSVAFYATDRASSLDLVGGEHVAERIVTLTRLIENASADRRAEIAQLASSSNMTVFWSDSNLVHSNRGASREERALAQIFTEHLARIGGRAFHLRYGDAGTPSAKASGPFAFPADWLSHRLSASLQLTDGSWLNFATDIQNPDAIWSLRFGLSLSVMVLAIMLISAVIVRHVNRPLHLFAKVAQRIGRDVGAPPLVATGPKEVRDVICAFNEMQARIRRLIEDRTQMLTAISHDLRTPITLLRLRAEFVADEAERARMLATLDDMETMIAGVLAFARDDATRETSERVDLRALVATICNDMADAGLAVEFADGPRLTVECRRHSITRAVTNLIDNAVKYGERACVRLEQDERSIMIIVEDDGPGIPDDQVETAFRPFVRLDPARGAGHSGTGLGLSIARAMVLANGGKLTLSNLARGGLRATVMLPR